ncbi:uncharacterized protein LOC129760590 [Uranotaenia lowii]|uniref:uncharacterized protein LOC129760590 n=1 Tax=Uranotaenia lowii TaxID=190385 RepID=UPI0024792863|nr:uncharacterized protein LOC129760590 [Uranotaenia lowii]
MSIQDYYGGASEELDIGQFAYCELTPMDEGEQSDSVASDPSQDIWQPGEVSLLKQLFEFFKDKGPKAYRNITAELKKHKFYFNPSQVEQKLRQLGLHISSVETSHVGIRGRNFSEVEDTQICRSWKTITNDATVGTDQARTKFWEKIQLHAARHQPSLATRPPDALRQRFNHLKKLVQKYLDCEVFAFRHQGSGTSYEDVLSIASKNFMVQNNLKEFRLQGCIEVLRNEPKFNTNVTKSVDSSLQSIPDFVESPTTSEMDYSEPATPRSSENRPLGQKASKFSINNSRKDVMEKLVDSINKKNDVLARNAKALEEATSVKIMATPIENLDEVAKEYFILKKKLILKDLQKETQAFESLISESDSD